MGWKTWQVRKAEWGQEREGRLGNKECYRWQNKTERKRGVREWININLFVVWQQQSILRGLIWQWIQNWKLVLQFPWIISPIFSLVLYFFSFSFSFFLLHCYFTNIFFLVISFYQLHCSGIHCSRHRWANASFISPCLR